MDLPAGLLPIVAQTRLFSDGKIYVILRVDLSQGAELASVLAAPFSAYVRDKDEITLVLSREAWDRVRPPVAVLDVSSGYRLITFDLPLDLGVVGYLAALATVLTDAGVSILPMAAFSRDHIFVTEADFDRAWKALRTFIRSCQAQESDLSL